MRVRLPVLWLAGILLLAACNFPSAQGTQPGNATGIETIAAQTIAAQQTILAGTPRPTITPAPVTVLPHSGALGARPRAHAVTATTAMAPETGLGHQGRAQPRRTGQHGQDQGSCLQPSVHHSHLLCVRISLLSGSLSRQEACQGWGWSKEIQR